MAAPDKRRLLALLFTDIKGYSRQMDADEAGALRRLEVHDGILEAAISANRGRIIKKMGDAFMVAFESAVEAVRCALAAQAELARHNDSAPEGERIEVRMGIHVGDVMERDGDLFGETVNLAARLEPQADPGTVCVSQAVLDQVRRKVEGRLLVQKTVTLKNISEPMQIGLLAPGTDTLELTRPAPPATARSRLPHLALFVGIAIVAGLIFTLFPGRVAREKEGPAQDPRSRYGGVLTMAFPLDSGWYDLGQGPSGIDAARQAMALVADPLFARPLPEGDPKPWAVERWVVSEDLRTVVLTLRASMRFHDHPCFPGGQGREATAEDLAFSIRGQMMDSGLLENLGLKVTTLKTVEPLQVRLLLPEPNGPHLLAMLGGVRLLPTFLERCGDPEKLLQIPGTGPFQMVTPRDSRGWSVERNPHYWHRGPQGERLPFLDGVQILALESFPRVEAAFERGALDLALQFSALKSGVKSTPSGKLVLGEKLTALEVEVLPVGMGPSSYDIGVLVVLPRSPALKDARVRRALAMALSRRMPEGYGAPRRMEPYARFLDARFNGFDPTLPDLAENLDEARRLLAEAGHPAGEGLPVLVLTCQEEVERYCQTMVEDLARVGVKIQLVLPPWGNFFSMIWSENNDLALLGIDGSYQGNEPWPWSISPQLLVTRSGHPEGLRLAHLNHQVTVEPDVEERGRLYRAFEKLLLESAPLIPLRRSVGHEGRFFLLKGPRPRGLIDPRTGRLKDAQSSANLSTCWLEDQQAAPPEGTP